MEEDDSVWNIGAFFCIALLFSPLVLFIFEESLYKFLAFTIVVSGIVFIALLMHLDNMRHYRSEGRILTIRRKKSKRD